MFLRFLVIVDSYQETVSYTHLVDANGIAEAVHTVVPDMIHQLLLTHGPSLMHHQVFQDSRFLTGQRQRLPVDGGGTGACVKGQAAAGQQHILLGELPQGQAANASLQLGKKMCIRDRLYYFGLRDFTNN